MEVNGRQIPFSLQEGISYLRVYLVDLAISDSS